MRSWRKGKACSTCMCVCIFGMRTFSQVVLEYVMVGGMNMTDTQLISERTWMSFWLWFTSVEHHIYISCSSSSLANMHHLCFDFVQPVTLFNSIHFPSFLTHHACICHHAISLVNLGKQKRPMYIYIYIYKCLAI